MTDPKGLALLRELDKAAKEYGAACDRFAREAMRSADSERFFEATRKCNDSFGEYLDARTALHRHLEGIS